MQSEVKPGSLNERFEGFGAAPSDALWGQIADALDDKKKRRGIIWWWAGGAMAAGLAALISFSLYQYASNGQIEESAIVAIDKLDQQNQIEAVQEDLTTDVVIIEEGIFNKDLIENKKQAEDIVQTDKPKQKLKIELGSEHLPIVKNDEQMGKISDIEIAHNVTILEKSEISLLETKVLTYPALECMDITRMSIDKPWEVGFTVDYWSDLNTQDYENDLGTTNMNEFALIDISASSIAEGTVSKNINVSGFLGKYLSSRWAWRTGLEYSQTKYFANYNSNSATTKVSSLSIPLGAKFDVVKRPKLKFRIGGSVVNEFPITEKVEADYTTYYESNSLFKMGYMAACQMDLTLDIKIGKNLFLSAAPTYRYYFIQEFKSQESLLRRDHWIGGKIGLTWIL